MGYYINPTDKSKESWLVEHGTRVHHSALKNFPFDSDMLPVCMVNNGLFTAAGICHNKAKLEEFLREDGRPKIFFLVSKKDLKPWYDK